jgi:hypothetical protein
MGTWSPNFLGPNAATPAATEALWFKKARRVIVPEYRLISLSRVGGFYRELTVASA